MVFQYLSRNHICKYKKNIDSRLAIVTFLHISGVAKNFEYECKDPFDDGNGLFPVMVDFTFHIQIFHCSEFIVALKMRRQIIFLYYVHIFLYLKPRYLVFHNYLIKLIYSYSILFAQLLSSLANDLDEMLNDLHSTSQRFISQQRTSISIVTHIRWVLPFRFINHFCRSFGNYFVYTKTLKHSAVLQNELS